MGRISDTICDPKQFLYYTLPSNTSFFIFFTFPTLLQPGNFVLIKLHIKLCKMQGYIPVRCVPPPALYHTGGMWPVSQTGSDITETPSPVDICKYITLPQTSFTIGKYYILNNIAVSEELASQLIVQDL